MARPKAFDEDQALQRALETFQAKGYEGTSIQDLVEAMGINRQSVYDTFGNKETLYQMALERYRGQVPAVLGDLIDGPLPFRQAFAAQFAVIFDRILSPGGLPCFLAQAALGRAAGHPASAACVTAGYRQNLQRLENRLRRAQVEGDLGAHHDPVALARFFQNTLHGLQVTARSGASRADLEAIIRVTLSILG